MTNAKPFPAEADCKALAEYFANHVANGRGSYRVEMREHYPAIPPEGDTHDDLEKIVFLRGVY